MKNRYLLKKGIALSVAVSITASMAIGTGTAYAAESDDSAVVQQADVQGDDTQPEIKNGDFESFEGDIIADWTSAKNTVATSVAEEEGSQNHVAQVNKGASTGII